MAFKYVTVCFFTCLLLSTSGLIAQSNSAKVSTERKSNKSAIELINEANSVAITNPVLSMSLATEALDNSIRDGNKAAQFQSYNTLGTLYFNISNYSKAATYFKLASNGFSTLGDSTSKKYSDKYLLASNAKLQEFKSFGKKDGDYNAKKGKSKTVYKSKKSEVELLNEVKSGNLNNADKVDIYKELGDIYLSNNDTGKAADYLNKAGGYSLNTDDKSLLENADKVGATWNNSGNYSANITYQNKVLQEGLKRGSSEIVGKATLNLGTTYIESQKPNDAIPFLQQSIAIYTKNGNTEQKQKSTRELARAYESAGQYDKALDVIKVYVSTMDSLKNLNERSVEENLALNEEFLKQEKRIQKLIITQKQKEADIKRQQFFLWGLAGILILFGGLIYALFRNIKQKQKANMVIKLQSLRTQMNPHFIFNSLNSVNNFISKNDERSANKYLTDFSKLMRTVLKNSDQDFVSLETEIQTLKIYLDLEHFRFGEKFDYSLEIADNIEPDQLDIPPMLIQPYIENAIWHGLRYKDEKGILELRFFIENDKLYCTIRDNGIGRKRSAELKTDNQKTYQSTGIKNTRERIDLLNKLHGTKLEISIFDLMNNGTADGTMVKISLPYILQTELV